MNPTSNQYEIRPAEVADIPRLGVIEQAASTLFANTRFAYIVDFDTLPRSFLEMQQRNKLLWVAAGNSGELCAFAAAMTLDKYLHLHELSVHPDHMRRGLGSQLTRTVIHRAIELKMPGVTLSTFRSISWNAPFYRKLGFRHMREHELTPALLRIRLRETESGIVVQDRTFMLYEFRPDSR